MADPELDPALLARLVRIGGRALLVQLIDSFTADASGRRASLTAARATQDLPALAAVAHALVAGSGQLGATGLSEDARALEESARRGDAADAAARVAPLLDRLAATLAALAIVREGA